MSESKRLDALITALICVAYVVLRVWRLAASCLWFDEIFSVDAATHTWDSILNFVALDLIHPPLFYILLKNWIVLGGQSLGWLRTFPVIFACMAVVPFLLICRELKFSSWTRNATFFLFAVNGSLIKYSQELRMYSLLLLLSLTSIWLFSRYFVKGKSFIPLLIVNLLLVYTHYFGWLIILTEVLTIGWLQRTKLRQILVQPAILAAAFLPWAYTVFSASQNGSDVGQNIGWMQKPGMVAVGTLFVNLVEPIYSQMNSGEAATRYVVSVPLALIIISTLIVGCIVRSRGDSSDSARSVGIMLAAFAAVPVVAAFLGSWILPYSVWGTRHLIIVFVPAILLIGIAIGRLSQVWVRAAIVGTIAGLTLISFSIELGRPEPNNIWCAWAALAERAADLGANKIVVFEDLVAYHAWFGTTGREGERPELVKVSNVEGLLEDKAYFIPRGRADIAERTADAIGESPVWLLYRGSRIEPVAPPLSLFVPKGYTITYKEIYAARSENAILLKLEK